MTYKILLDDIQNNHDKFLEIHEDSDLYGGSTVADICGVGYNSPLKVWLRKTKKIPPQPATPQMKLGIAMESVVRDLLAETLQKEVKPVNQIWQNEERPWMIATPDAICEQKLVEIKTHKIYAEKYWSEDSASDSSMCQIAWYLSVSGLSGGYCVALIAGDTEKFFHPYFERDDALISQLLEQVEKFRELVKSDLPPGAGPGDANLIREHLIKSIDATKRIDLTATHRDMVGELIELQSQYKEAKARSDGLDDKVRAIKNTLIKDSGGAGLITVGSNLVHIKKVVRSAYECKASEYFTVQIK